jgi:hypothetical protein
MTSLPQLHQDHFQVEKLVGQLRELISEPAPPPSVQLFDVRRRLTNLIIAHLKSEDWVLYPPLLASSDPEIAGTAQRFVEEMGGLAQAFHDFMAAWDALKIESEWPDYCRECGAILDALMNRLTREDRELLPLLEKVSADPA